MESLSGLMYGLSIAFQPGNLFFCFLGCVVGTWIGVLPGIGPTGTLALLLPITFHLPSSTAIIIFGLTLISFLGSGSKLKAFMMGGVGLLLGTIGSDPVESVDRFTFGSFFLLDGVGLIPLIMGLFGISEIFLNLEEEEFRTILKEKIKNLFPNGKEWVASVWPMVRGTLIGLFMGIIPGGTPSSPLRCPMPWKKEFPNTRKNLARGSSKALPGPNRPTYRCHQPGPQRHHLQPGNGQTPGSGHLRRQERSLLPRCPYLQRERDRCGYRDLARSWRPERNAPGSVGNPRESLFEGRANTRVDPIDAAP